MIAVKPDIAPRGCTNFKLRQLLRRVSLVYDRAMAECGLKITQYSLLTHVEKLGPITQADLAKTMGMDSSRFRAICVRWKSRAGSPYMRATTHAVMPSR